MNKRIISILLSLVMVFSVLATAVPVLAATPDNAITITPDKTEAHPGDTITYTLNIGKVESIGIIQFALVFPSDLEYVANSATIPNIDALKVQLNVNSAGELLEWWEADKTFAYVEAESENSISSETTLLTFKCKIKDTADGDYVINWSDAANGDLNAFADSALRGMNDITISYDNSTSKVKVTPNSVAVSDVTLNHEKLSLTEGETATLTATVSPEHATDKTVTWSSDDEKVATVENGTVTAVKKGTTTITATAGEASASSTVTVSCAEIDANNDHNCDICGTKLSDCADANNDHKCDVCGTKLSDCANANNDHNCDVCGTKLSDCADTNNDHNCDVCGTKLSDCADTNNDHKCDVCGADLSCKHTGEREVRDAADATCGTDGYTGDTYCKDCGDKIEEGTVIPATGEHTDTDEDEVCDVCDTELTEDPTPDDTEYVEIELEVGATATETQNGLSSALTDADITVDDDTIVSVTMEASKKTSGNSWWDNWGGNSWGSIWGDNWGDWWSNSSGTTTYDHTITFEALAEGTTVVQVGEVSYKITVIEAHEHEYESAVTEPTCTEQGYTTYTCDCGDSYVDNYVEASGHNYEDGVCGNCGEDEPENPEIPETFAPKSFTASLSKSSVTVGKSVTITVKTSTDVDYVEINGEVVDTYRTTTTGWGFNKTKYRTFTYTVSEDAAGTYEYEVYAYNADGAQSEISKTLTLTVKESGGGSNWGWGDWWWN